MPKRVIIDCDVGVDDALALILAYHSRKLMVEAVTGVSGNVPLDIVFENIQKVLCLVHPKDRPLIARGADRPLKGKPLYARPFHGESGLGRARIEKEPGEKWYQLFSGKADELIPMMARRYPNELTLIALGPLTNVALALRKDPEGMKKLQALVIMGGAVRVEGNVTPRAEFNIFVDPLAAKTVFESGLSITLVPLDVTRQVGLTSRIMTEHVDRLNNPFSRFVSEATQYDSATGRFAAGRDAYFLHDPLAVGVVIDPSLVEMEHLPIRVVTEEGDSYGQTQEGGHTARLDVCLKVDSKKFLELFLSSLSGPFETGPCPKACT